MKCRAYLKTCFVLVFVTFLIYVAPQVFAGISDTGVDTAGGETLTTNPKKRTTSVTASVRDSISPSVPILVTPDNGSSTSTNTITFTWKSSSDDYGINRYLFYFDGDLLFDTITPPAKILPLKYDYSEKDAVSTLVMKYAFADGSHTWKVRAYDNNENYADSATWSFTIDTSAPILLISNVGEVATSISAQDVGTIPTDPLVLYVNSPTISGKTEAGAGVVSSYLVSRNEIITLSTTADSLGNYSFTLPLLPLKVVITFQVVAQDGVGNTTIIDNVRFKIIRKTIPVPGPIKEIIPEIPIVPLEEIRQKILTFLKSYIPEPIVEIVDVVSPLTNSALGLAIPLARLLAALWLIGAPIWNWSLRTVLQTAHAVGMWPSVGLSPFWLPPVPHHAQGIVFDLDTQKPVPFALITALRLDPEGPSPVEQCVSNKDGTYETLRFPSTGSYVLVPTHRDYAFDPSTVVKRFSGMQEVYKGETISKESCSLQPPKKVDAKFDANPLENTDEGIECTQKSIFAHLYIPMVHLKRSVQERLALSTAVLPDNGLAFSTAMMAVIAFLSPSPWNIGFLVLYSFAMVRRLITA